MDQGQGQPAEQTLESEQRFRTLVELAPESIVVHRDLRILYINTAGAALLGVAAEQLLGRHLLDFTVSWYHDEVKERMRQVQGATERVPYMRQRLRRNDGTEVDIEVASAPCVYSGQPAVLTMARDLSQERKLEEELRQAQKVQSIGQLTGGIAHDFKNILSIILTTVEYLRDAVPADSAEVGAAFDDIRTAARRGAEMITRLMAYSRRAELRPVPTSLADVVKDVNALLERLLPDDIAVGIDVEEGVAAAHADATAVEQILLNLATNARDAMPKGGSLRLAVSRTRLEQAVTTDTGPIGPGEFACLSVSDSGAGMDEVTRSRMFEPFFTTKAPGKGTGLGMAMVQGLMTQLGGAIAVETAPGRGTTFRLYFPAAGAPLPPRATTAEMLLARTDGKLSRGTERILVVEDEDPLRRASQRMLEKLGYTVLTACDGEEGLAVLRARAGEIDLVISDTVMPRMDGFTLFRTVRREMPAVRFLFATGFQAEELAERTGMPVLDAPFITKPWTITEYAMKVRQVLDSPLGAPMRQSRFDLMSGDFRQA